MSSEVSTMASSFDKEASPSQPNQAAEVPSSRATADTIDTEKAEAPSNTSAWGDAAPDGGAAAWLCVLGAWCTSFCSFGWINSESSSCRFTRSLSLPGVRSAHLTPVMGA
jgi:hypothetical protein